MADHWIASGLLTHADAVKARNELIEDPDIEDPDCLEVGCYITKDKQMRYGVKLVYAEDGA